MSAPSAASAGVNSPPFADRELAGWGNFPRARSRVYRPESERDLLGVIRAAGTPLISRGLGRSYGDAALNAGGAVTLHDRLDRFIAFDEASGVLEAESGVSLDEVLRVFLPRGWFLPVTPGTRFVTLGGAVAADVHGKNHHRDGCFSAFVEDLTLLTAPGETLRCSRETNPEAFWATVGGMGLTGSILSVRLRLRRVASAWCDVEYRRAENIDRALELFAEDARHTYSVAWIDCLAGGKSLGRSVVMRAEHAPPDRLPARRRSDPLRPPARRARAVPFFAPEWLLSPLSVRAFNAVYYRAHGGRRALVDCHSFFYPLDGVLNWNRLYGRRGFAQYQAVIPAAAGRAGIVELVEAVSRSGLGSFLAVLKTFGPQNQGMLSFPMAGHTLALDVANSGEPLARLAARLDDVVLRHGGRVYLAKDSLLSAASFERMYPRAGEFRRAVSRLDPAGVYSSSLSRRLGITGGRA